MQSFKEYLNSQLDACVTDMKYFESKCDMEGIVHCERQINEIKAQIAVLDSIIDEKEGNIVRFTNNDNFQLICVRITDVGEQIIERYDGVFTKDTYDDVLETAKCYNITQEFNMSELFESIDCTSDLSEHEMDVNYFVTNDTINL